MRISEVIIEAADIEPVTWPTNYAWRIPFQRYKNVNPLVDVRKNKLFAMPFRNWVSTYWHLTGKDVKKIKYMQTQIIKIPDNAIVADMSLIDSYFSVSKSNLEAAKKILDEYVSSAVPYSKFKNNPFIFSQPEILVEPNTAQTIQGRVVITSQIEPNVYPPTPLLGIKQQ